MSRHSVLQNYCPNHVSANTFLSFYRGEANFCRHRFLERSKCLSIFIDSESDAGLAAADVHPETDAVAGEMIEIERLAVDDMQALKRVARLQARIGCGDNLKPSTAFISRGAFAVGKPSQQEGIPRLKVGNHVDARGAHGSTLNPGIS